MGVLVDWRVFGVEVYNIGISNPKVVFLKAVVFIIL